MTIWFCNPLCIWQILHLMCFVSQMIEVKCTFFIGPHCMIYMHWCSYQSHCQKKDNSNGAFFQFMLHWPSHLDRKNDCRFASERQARTLILANLSLIPCIGSSLYSNKKSYEAVVHAAKGQAEGLFTIKLLRLLDRNGKKRKVSTKRE